MEQGETAQYRRHISLEGFGIEKQQQLKKSSVLVVGAGGLGCSVLQYLVAAGVGKIGIVDDDRVEISNLQRQVLFSHDDQGELKAEIAAKKLARMNPFIDLTSYPKRLDRDNCRSLLEDYDLVVDGTDNFSSRYLINDACVLFNKPLVHGSINQFEGMVSVFNFNGGPTYRCLFPQQPDPSSIPSCAEAGVLGVLPGIIGCLQALEAIKVLTGLGEPLSGKVLLYNALNQSNRTLNLKVIQEHRTITTLPTPIESCTEQDQIVSHMNANQEISEHELHQMMIADNKLQILDVREDWERQQAHIKSSIHQPLNNLLSGNIKLSSLGLDPNKNLVIYCKAGVRSKLACQALEPLGFSLLFNLSNGMDGWIKEFPELTV